MKKSILFIGLIAITAIFVSCSGKKQTQQIGNESVASLVDESGKAKSVNLIPCVLFWDEGSLFSENKDGKLDWFVTLNAGQTLYAYPKSDDSLSDIVEQKEMTRSGKKESEEYIKVRYDTNDYWINASFLAPNTTANVIIADGITYSSDDITDVSSKIAIGEIIAVSNDYVTPEDSDVKFTKITYRDSRSYRNVYVKSEIVSNSSDDILALRLLSKAKTLKNEVAFNELFEILGKLTTSDYVKSQIYSFTK